ncbi:ribosome recycling factor [Chthonomonas calidirosea]|uniref:Ribosome-recycling factor n=1 Tax=Chthonomonas calidirosea (strain DSM 23976 / ICMP 18418 / T49) TaxID=1303518 RepID=S0EUK8_CHTCT|nr:ribosome recycling factor [Chthonomonas calidirosea]CCW35348.1 ribosome recycling factor [Chthonomonas calidirosea T49]CEK19567.1 ribosome recycling factor [Chthonomonas calidirosea]CEK19568.1 ribosome recycling factor [Chthonomonas calidirosea]CEK20542.1 ribosome recycling factor [Chthonomonas calidirosea]
MIQETLREAEERMKKAVEATQHEFSLIRTGRANPAILEHVRVDAYGTTLPLNQVASISVPEPRQLLITPFDRNILPQIEKGILKSDVGITPTNDGSALRLNIPPLNEERRKELIKQVHQKAEQGRASIRTVRHEAIKKLQTAKKASEISENEEKRAEEQVQKLVDKYTAEIDHLMKVKEAELMEV